MVRCSVDMVYFPFFFGADFFFAAEVFFAAVFFGAAARATVFFGAAVLDLDLDFAFAAGFSSPSVFAAAFRRATGAPSFSATGVSVWPIAVASISTTSDQSRWYVETSEY